MTTSTSTSAPTSAQPLWRHVCCAVDGSSASRAAFERALDIARSFRAELMLVHILHQSRATGALFAPPLAGGGPIAREAEYLASWIEEALETVPAATTFELSGPPAEKIVAFVEQFGCDVLVLGVSGRRGLLRPISDQLAARILGMAPCPVLVVRETERPVVAHP